MKRTNTRATRARNQRILAASDVCHLCGRPGADAIDHVVPLARGGADDLTNLKPVHHNVEPKCNRRKGDKLPTEVDRKVILICGPPGAGKTTYAHTLDMTVYDLDDPQWNGNDTAFRGALSQVRDDPAARAVVIRTGATLSARQKAASLCGATDLVVLDTDLPTCLARIKERGRTDPPLNYQINGARSWWDKYEPGDVKLSFATLRLKRSGALA